MAETKGFEVLVDELTIHQAVRELKHPITGEPMGYQQGNGATWFLGEIVPANQINPEWVKALEEGDDSNPLYQSLSTRLAPSREEPVLSDAVRMGAPFEGYDDMDLDDILVTMRVLPSATVTRIKEWEAANEGREEIVNFNIGFGVSPNDYQEGKVPGGDASAAEETDPTKAVRAMRTRQVADPGEDGPTIPGEGVTGTGDPPVEPGTAAAEEEEDGEGGTTKRRAPKRRAGRRTRQTKQTEDTKPSGQSGDGS